MATTQTVKAPIIQTINLRPKLVKIHTTRRLKKALDYLRDHISRHSKTDPASVKISGELNDYMMRNVARGLGRVKVTVDKTAKGVNVDLAPELKKKPKAQETKPSSKADAKKPDEGKGKKAEENAGKDRTLWGRINPAKKNVETKGGELNKKPAVVEKEPPEKQVKT